MPQDNTARTDTPSAYGHALFLQSPYQAASRHALCSDTRIIPKCSNDIKKGTKCAGRPDDRHPYCLHRMRDSEACNCTHTAILQAVKEGAIELRV